MCERALIGSRTAVPSMIWENEEPHQSSIEPSDIRGRKSSRATARPKGVSAGGFKLQFTAAFSFPLFHPSKFYTCKCICSATLIVRNTNIFPDDESLVCFV